MSDSIWNDPRITAYVLGELSSAEKTEFEREIETSDELAQAVEDARSLTGLVKDLYANESSRPLDRERRESIVTLPSNTNSSGSATLAPAAGVSRSWRVPGLVLAIAATLLLMIGVGPWLNRSQETALKEIDEAAPAGEVAERTSVRSRIQDADLAAATVAEPQTSRFRSDQGETLDDVTTLLAPLRSQSPASGRGRVELDLDAESDAAKAAGNVKLAEEEEPIQAARSRRPAEQSSFEESSASQPPAEQFADESAQLAQDNNEASEIVLRQKNSPADAPRQLREKPRVSGRSDDSNRGLGGIVPKSEISKGAIVLKSDGRELRRSDLLRAGTAGVAEGVDEKRATEASGGIGGGGGGMALGGNAQPRSTTTEWGRGGRGSEAKRLNQQRPPSADRTTSVELDELERLAIPQLQGDEGRGPGQGGDKFEPITDNPFKRVSEHRLSTFSVDVDTASYSKTRDFLLNTGQLPRPDAVRIEELVNYFDYDYTGPGADDAHPFTAHTVVTSCPWNPDHRLARIALKGKTIETEERPRCNLVFLLDTSGSMDQPNKLPLVIDGMKMLVDQLDKKDRVAIAVYAGSAGLVLDSTKVKKKDKILRALTQLNAGGSTNGGAGIALAYQTARDNFISDGVNRVILCTDGDFNVGTTGTDSLVRMVEQEAKGGIFLTVLGFGMGNHNDSMLEQVSGRGNGNYAFIDSQQEARKVLVQQTNGTLVTIAKDVKLQIEFNPLQVSAYRLIGYENRVLAKEDFNDDKKDAGEIGAGHAVTALYEIVPAGVEADAIPPAVDESRYIAESTPTDAAKSGELMTLKLRYKQPDGDTSTLVEFPVKDDDIEFADADQDVRFAAAVAGFGMQLRRSEYRGSWTLSEVLKTAQGATGHDESGLRQEFIEMVRRASQLMGQ